MHTYQGAESNVTMSWNILRAAAEVSCPH
jgi:hypothetical protein